mgnify:CR=1 FL=1
MAKPVGSDEKNHKVTYVRLNGLEQSKKDVEALSEEALKFFLPLTGEMNFWKIWFAH